MRSATQLGQEPNMVFATVTILAVLALSMGRDLLELFLARRAARH